MIQFAWLIPLLPLVGALINGVGYRSLPKNIVSIIACGSVLASFIITAGIFFEMQGGAYVSQTLTLYNIIDVGYFTVPLSLLIDHLSVMMALIITGVGFLIHLYSVGYMSHDEGFARYFGYLNLFVFAMLMLVLGSNYILMFVGWEGVGFCSFLLIGFWFKDNNNTLAAKKAFVMNRIGDVGFLIGIYYIATTFKSISYADVFSQAASFRSGTTILTVITILLFIGATAKSAQIPLLTWLPDAMAGPTPVSALIHAATMVTAGIYMIVRSSILFTLSPLTMEIISYIGIATALVGAFIALTQNDIKKVLAYSTVSQLGYMFVALGVGAFTTGMFHLTTHAFFKALLFLGAGSVIHAMSGEQDIRKMGGLKKSLPITFATFLIGVLAIIGIPPFSGFFSKDELLAKVVEHSPVLGVLLAITFILTAIYILRMFFLVFWGNFRGSKEQGDHLHESPWVMTVPLILLGVLAFAGGFMNVPEVLGGNHMLENYLAPVIQASLDLQYGGHLSHTTELILMASVVTATVIVGFAVYRKYVTNAKIPAGDEVEKPALYRLSSNKLYIDELYEKVVTYPVNKISEFFYKIVEINLIDRIVNFFGETVTWASGTLRYVQTGNTGIYLLVMVIGISLMLLFNFMI